MRDTAITAMEKLISTFGTGLIDKISPVTGRLHPSYSISAAKTGRFSSNNPNIQQIVNAGSKMHRLAGVKMHQAR
jgi:DNA polymerase I-like protein with 3'-5' exonuclease and polymerase domains